MTKSTKAPRHRLTQKKKLWEFINSNICQFILTTLVVGTFSHFYLNYRDNKKIEDTNHQRELMLLEELKYRLPYLRSIEKSQFTYTELWTAKEAINGEPQPYEHGQMGEYSILFPEFKGASIASLLWQLESLSSPKKKHDFDIAIESAKKLPYFTNDNHYIRISKVSDENDSVWGISLDELKNYSTVLSRIENVENP